LSRELTDYFPKPLQEKFNEYMPQHRLKREIIATMVTNSLVNRMGASFSLRIHEDTGGNPGQVARAYTIAREILDARVFWQSIEALDNQVEASVQTRALLEQWDLLRHVTRWLLNQPGHQLDIQHQVDRFSNGIARLRTGLNDLLGAEDQQRLLARADEYQQLGLPVDLSASVAQLPWLAPSPDIVDEASRRDVDVLRVAEVYFRLGDRMNLKWLAEQVEKLAVDGQWHANARSNLRDELYSQHRALTSRVLHLADTSAHDLVDQWMHNNRTDVARSMDMLADMRNLPKMDYATVSVALRGLEQLVIATS